MESLRTSVFYDTLEKEHGDLLKLCRRRGYLICIPQSCSLTRKVSRADIGVRAPAAAANAPLGGADGELTHLCAAQRRTF